MMWPESDDDFALIVDRAMNGTCVVSSRMRERLADDDVIGRTVRELSRVVGEIDEQLDTWSADDAKQSARERVRDRFYGWLVWYETVQAMQVADG